MTETVTHRLNAAELTLDQMLNAIGDGKRALAAIGIIPCICCSRPFRSRGAHNRVCQPCRAAAPEF